MTSGRLKQPIWIVPLLMAAVVAVFGWWGQGRLRETVEDQLKAKLTSTLDANVTALEIWTTNQTRLALSLAQEPEIRNPAVRLLEQPLPGIAERRPSDLVYFEEWNNHIRPRIHGLGYEIAQLVNTNCVIVASSTRTRFGFDMPVSEAHTNKYLELFASGQPILITPFKPELPGGARPFARSGRNGEPGRGFPPTPNGRGLFRPRGTNDFRRRGDITLMQVAAPLENAGVIEGALALVINPTNEFSRILSVAQSGKSGETYAFDQTGLLISRSRFDDQLKELTLLDRTNSSSALNLRLHDPGGDLAKGFKLETNLASLPLIRIVANAVEGEDGVDVRPLTRLSWCARRRCVVLAAAPRLWRRHPD